LHDNVVTIEGGLVGLDSLRLLGERELVSCASRPRLLSPLLGHDVGSGVLAIVSTSRVVVIHERVFRRPVMLLSRWWSDVESIGLGRRGAATTLRVRANGGGVAFSIDSRFAGPMVDALVSLTRIEQDQLIQ
jgi:hypothetical protein